MNINLWCFGKIDDKNLKNLIDDFIRKIGFYSKLNIFEFSEFFSADLKQNQQKNEEQVVSKKIDIENTFLFDIDGKKYSSIELSKKVLDYKDFGKTINFLIGPSDGFSAEFKSKFSKKISFGNITLPHQIFRLVFFEQIYRVFKIINNEKYHK